MDELARVEELSAAGPGKKLAILLSAYACEPGRGSEPGIGWQWAVQLAALGHNVWVITRANNRPAIERAVAAQSLRNLSFIYHDLPRWASFWKKGGRGVRLYYSLWQIGAYRAARRLQKRVRFDVVHHITFGVFRHPSFMAFLGVPFVFGPLGGGESAPMRLRRGIPWRGHVVDFLRDTANSLVRFDPIMGAVFGRSAVTLCKTKETLSCIPSRFHAKCRIQSELATPDGLSSPVHSHPRPLVTREDGEFRVLFVGRLLYLKGLHLALVAFAHACRTLPSARFTIIGSGRDEVWARRLARRLAIDDRIEWVPWMPREQLLNAYSKYDVFLFPSLHDSSGNVVLEAMAEGLPVVCLGLGGPAVLVDDSCGIVVPLGSGAEVTTALGDGLVRLATDTRLHARLSHQARYRARLDYSWHSQVRRMEQIYLEIA